MKHHDQYHTLCGEQVTTRLLHVLSTVRVLSVLSVDKCTPERILVMRPEKVRHCRGCGERTYKEFLALQEKLNQKQNEHD